MKKLISCFLLIVSCVGCSVKGAPVENMMVGHSKPTVYDLQISLEDFCIMINKMENKETDAHEIGELIDEAIEHKMLKVSHYETEKEQHIIYIINPIVKRLGNIKMKL